MQAITEEGNKIMTCVNCEKWFEETELIGVPDEKTGETKYYLCRECLREEREAERD